MYTEGFALNGLYYAYRALENKTFLIKAKKLGDFLCSIQIKNTSPLIDGAWRGMYDLKTGAYGGSIHESSSAEEGGLGVRRLVFADQRRRATQACDAVIARDGRACMPAATSRTCF